MSGLTEQEILNKHREALGEGRKACLALVPNANRDHIALRGGHYQALKKALKELEGSCRQMAHWRADARWLKLGIVYARAMRSSQAKFAGQSWLWFGELAKLFELGQRRMDDLSTNRTGRVGMILPQRPSSWLILPDQHRISQGTVN